MVLRCRGGNLYFSVNSPTLGANFFPLVPFSPKPNQWYHLAVTKAGTLFTVYINGAVAGTATFTSPVPSPNAPLTIGSAERIGFMNGILDEITAYNRALSQTELQSIFNAGSAGKCKLPTTIGVSPSVGGDAGQVTVTLSGSQFLPTSTVSLTASGSPSINGSTPIVSPNSASDFHHRTGHPPGRCQHPRPAHGDPTNWARLIWT